MDADAIIVGAGACGLMCAVQAGFLGKRVILLEKSEKPGKKILISGGGRCNFTNLHTTEAQFISANEHFCKSVLAQWSVEDTISFFSAYDITGKEKTLGQLFPDNKNARDVVAVFTEACESLSQDIICNADIKNIENTPTCFNVVYSQNGKDQAITAPKLVIATGGLPIPKMGATDFALRFARKHQLPLTETAPALVPLTITGKEEAWYAQLSGNSVFCCVSNERISFEEQILFTHWGLRPAILQLSSYWRPGETIRIDFLPSEDIINLIEKARTENGRMLLSTFLNRLYTKRFTDAIGLYLPLSKHVADLNKQELEQLKKTIHHFFVKPAGDKGYDKAEVMRGGIDTASISSKTLECKTISGLYFGGECLDVTGWLGGYNFQWAWASGYVIAKNL